VKIVVEMKGIKRSRKEAIWINIQWTVTINQNVVTTVLFTWMKVDFCQVVFLAFGE
jgi:hypothetical protein